MARALIVGCGCRGRGLGTRLLADGWQVRGTSRTEAGAAAIAEAGIEPAVADPDRAGTIVELVGDVAVVVWALGSARGADELVAAVNGPRLQRVLEHLVDTPVRGFVYEATGTAPAKVLAAGEEAVRAARDRWRLPAVVVGSDPADHGAWTRTMADAAADLVAGGGR